MPINDKDFSSEVLPSHTTIPHQHSLCRKRKNFPPLLLRCLHSIADYSPQIQLLVAQCGFSKGRSKMEVISRLEPAALSMR